jgi:hypothetical protein
MNAAEIFDAVSFETSDNRTVLITGHPMLMNLSSNSLNTSGLEYYKDAQEILHINVFLPSTFLNRVLAIQPTTIDNILVETFINQAATDKQSTYTAIPTQLNYLFNKVLNQSNPITQLADIKEIDDNIALQYIAKVLTRKLPNRPSLIGPYLANIKKQYGNDNSAYQAAMQPIKQALYNTLHYLTDLDTQTVESLNIAQKIITANELGNYFYLSGGTLLMYMISNLLSGTDKEANIPHIKKFEQYLQGLLQMPAK